MYTLKYFGIIQLDFKCYSKKNFSTKFSNFVLVIIYFSKNVHPIVLYAHFYS